MTEAESSGMVSTAKGSATTAQKVAEGPTAAGTAEAAKASKSRVVAPAAAEMMAAGTMARVTTAEGSADAARL
eukprot:6202035-Pleurochrysis_carterae.AAC.1